MSVCMYVRIFFTITVAKTAGMYACVREHDCAQTMYSFAKSFSDHCRYICKHFLTNRSTVSVTKPFLGLLT